MRLKLFQYPSNRVVDRSLALALSKAQGQFPFQYPSNRVVDRSSVRFRQLGFCRGFSTLQIGSLIEAKDVKRIAVENFLFQYPSNRVVDRSPDILP